MITSSGNAFKDIPGSNVKSGPNQVDTKMNHHILHLLISLVWSVGPSTEALKLGALCLSREILRISKYYIKNREKND